MRILVLGGGAIGASAAEVLCPKHRVTIVERDPDVARLIDDNPAIDARVIQGSASQSSALFQAGALDADLCLAVTNDDEVNLVAASVAKAMGSRRSIARVYQPIFLDTSTFDYRCHFHIDRLINLELLAAMDLARVVRLPGALAVENFAVRDLELQEIEVKNATAAVHVPLRQLKLGKGVRVAAIVRGDEVFIAGAEDTIEVGDRVTLLGKREEIDAAKDQFEIEPPQRLGVVIAGGGETGYHLARLLEGKRFAVLLMESNRDRAEFLAAHLDRTTVVCRDIRNRADLEEEGVPSADFFLACTGDDENNIIACVEAKELGVKKVAAVVGRTDYLHILAKLGIDYVTTPRQVVIREVEAHLNTGAVISRKPLVPDSRLLVVELDVFEGAPVTQHVLATVGLPHHCLIAARIRGESVTLPGADDRIKPGDNVVALVHADVLDELVQLFSPSD